MNAHPRPSSEQEWFTLDEVAARLKVSYDTVRRATRKKPGQPGYLRSVLVGRQRRIPGSALDELLAGGDGGSVIPLERKGK